MISVVLTIYLATVCRRRGRRPRRLNAKQNQKQIEEQQKYENALTAVQLHQLGSGPPSSHVPRASFGSKPTRVPLSPSLFPPPRIYQGYLPPPTRETVRTTRSLPVPTELAVNRL